MSRAIALVDCDSFFASCEQLVNPSLIGQPVCVMSNNDGCVIARSKEAKALGVKMGMPVFMAKKEFPNVHYLSGKLGLYGDISGRVMTTLRGFSPIVEIYSIDEAFIDLSGLRKMYGKSYLEITEHIKNEVYNRVGVPVSVGVSLNKTLAKLATERAKKDQGYYSIGFRQITQELKNTDLINIWGVGANTSAFLNRFGIHSAYEFSQQSDLWVKNKLGKKGLELKQELLGNNIYRLSEAQVLPKSIQKTSSFGNFTNSESYIKSALNYHVHRACKKLRRLRMKTSLVSVMLRTKDFQVHSFKKALVKSTDWEFDVSQIVNEMFYQIYNPSIIYRSSGVTFSSLSLSNDEQLSLFNSIEEQTKGDNLAKAWDNIEHKYGSGTLQQGLFKDHHKKIRK